MNLRVGRRFAAAPNRKFMWETSGVSPGEGLGPTPILPDPLPQLRCDLSHKTIAFLSCCSLNVCGHCFAGEVIPPLPQQISSLVQRETIAWRRDGNNRVAQPIRLVGDSHDGLEPLASIADQRKLRHYGLAL